MRVRCPRSAIPSASEDNSYGSGQPQKDAVKVDKMSSPQASQNKLMRDPIPTARPQPGPVQGAELSSNWQRFFSWGNPDLLSQ